MLNIQYICIFINVPIGNMNIIVLSLQHQITTKNNIMKTVKILSITVLIIVSVIIALAELNYITANNAAKKSEGSDSAIEYALIQHGFNLAWHEDATLTDKVKALFKIQETIYNKPESTYEVVTVYTAYDIYYLTNIALMSETGDVLIISDNRKMLVDSLETLTANDANTANGL